MAELLARYEAGKRNGELSKAVGVDRNADSNDGSVDADRDTWADIARATRPQPRPAQPDLEQTRDAGIELGP